MFLPPLKELSTWAELIVLLWLSVVGWYLLVRAGWELLRRGIALLRRKR